MATKKKYSLTLKQEIIDLDGVEYKLKEMTGTVRDQYMQEFNARMVTSADGKTKIINYTGLQSKLVSFCLFDDHDNPVAEEVISKWPSSTVNALFDDAQLISGIKKGDQEAKKDSAGSVLTGST